jgi:hypothetical protein
VSVFNEEWTLCYEFLKSRKEPSKMKKYILSLLLLLSFQGALADSPTASVRLSDGRICKDCIVEVKKGFVVSIKDATGDEWLEPNQPMKIYILSTQSWSGASTTYTTPAGSPPSTQPHPNTVSTITAPTKPTWAEFKPVLDLGLPYWKKREAQFNQEIALCETTSTDKAMCYLQVRQLESQKNAMHRLEK